MRGGTPFVAQREPHRFPFPGWLGHLGGLHQVAGRSQGQNPNATLDAIRFYLDLACPHRSRENLLIYIADSTATVKTFHALFSMSIRYAQVSNPGPHPRRQRSDTPQYSPPRTTALRRPLQSFLSRQPFPSSPCVNCSSPADSTVRPTVIVSRPRDVGNYSGSVKAWGFSPSRASRRRSTIRRDERACDSSPLQRRLCASVSPVIRPQPWTKRRSRASLAALRGRQGPLLSRWTRSSVACCGRERS